MILASSSSAAASRLDSGAPDGSKGGGNEVKADAPTRTKAQFPGMIPDDLKEKITEAEELQKTLVEKLSNTSEREQAINRAWEARLQKERKDRMKAKEQYIDARSTINDLQTQLTVCEQEVEAVVISLSKVRPFVL